MTAEIAILNTSGIALAADSAVTIGTHKVYNSANKLFTLSKFQPVGIMVFDSADLMGIPWEVIIKQYRSKLHNKKFAKLSQYAGHFLEFLKTDEHVIPNSNRMYYIRSQAYTYLKNLYDELEKSVEQEIEETGQTTIDDSIAKLDKIVQERANQIEKYDYVHLNQFVLIHHK